jgi:hypothetical protein
VTRSQENRARDRVLRSWIMQAPRPVTIRVTTGDGERQTVAVGTGSWAQLAATVLTLGPEMLEALDGSGNVLRATSIETLFEEREPEAVEAERHATTPAPPPRPPTNALELAGDDPESRRFALFAHLLSDAYRHATDVAFARIAEISAQQTERASSAERALDQFIRAEQLRLEVMRAELDQRRVEEQEAAEEEPTPGMLDEAVSKIAKSVADHVGVGLNDDDDDEEQPHAAPNGAAGGH